MSAKEKSITKYRVVSINLSCKRENKHKEGDSKVCSLICLLFVLNYASKKNEKNNETFLTLNIS